MLKKVNTTDINLQNLVNQAFWYFIKLRLFDEKILFK